MIYAAVEILGTETPHEVVEAIMKVAEERGDKFKALEVLGIMTLGTLPLLRFKSDCSADTVMRVKGRAYIIPTKEGFRVYDGLEEGPVESRAMTQPPWQNGQHRMYRGTFHQFWARQFLANVKVIP